MRNFPDNFTYTNAANNAKFDLARCVDGNYDLKYLVSIDSERGGAYTPEFMDSQIDCGAWIIDPAEFPERTAEMVCDELDQALSHLMTTHDLLTKARENLMFALADNGRALNRVVGLAREAAGK